MKGKSKQIRDLMKIGVFDPKWTLPSNIKRHLLVKVGAFNIENGLPVSI